METNQDRVAAAYAAVIAAESKSVSTQNRAWKKYFAAVDAAKASGAWV